MKGRERERERVEMHLGICIRCDGVSWNLQSISVWNHAMTASDCIERAHAEDVKRLFDVRRTLLSSCTSPWQGLPC